MLVFAYAFLFSVSPLLSAFAVAHDPLATSAEKSGWARTGRYDEAVALCERFQKRYPRQAKCTRFGTTPEGRPMVALIASADGTLTPRAASARGRPVVLAQGSIHAGECDGKDAGFLLLRGILAGRTLPGVLSKVTFVFVPVFNVDGHERFGRNNRPNQVGPEEMGWRVTSHNLNLNRDYVKADAPEMAAMLRFLGEWDPILYADLHVTDGADFQHEVSVGVQPSREGPEGLREAGGKLVDGLMASLTARRHLPLPFYPEFRTEGDPLSGFAEGVSPPRFSHAYWALRNRIGVLVETHSWKDYATRVRATAHVLEDLLSLAARDGSAWRKAAVAADDEGKRLGGRSIVLSYENTETSKPIDFLAYEFKRVPSDLSGGVMVTYDPAKPVTLKVPLFDEIRAKAQATAPKRGYLVPPQYAALMEAKLKLHGVRYERVNETATREVEAFRSTLPEFSPKSYEGHQTLKLKGEWKPERLQTRRGSLFVPIAQARARLVAHLFEPAAPDSFVAWGFFNAAFEQKEYMEPYVAEQVGREMMARDPAVKAEFESRLAADPEFAKSPEKRLEFFYRKHPSWDSRYGLYPVYRW